MKQNFIGIILTFLLAFMFIMPAHAGGWAIISLDELPADVTAGQPLEIGFTVLQHGVTPLDGLHPSITAQLSGTNKTLAVTAEEDGEAGHYAATLTFPESGTWSWKINAFTVQSMPPLSILPASQVLNTPSTTPAIPLALMGVGLLGSVIAIVGASRLKNKTRWALFLVMMGLIIGGAGFASAAAKTEVKIEAPVSPLAVQDQAELGRSLFIAKGCLICHYHEETAQEREFGVDMGPNLTNFTATPEYLRMWLKDPKSVKPETKMPMLKLTSSEMEALIAFINSD